MVNFNPRPPRGGRLGGVFVNLSKWIFQSTPPARGATLVLGWLWRDFEYFNPRPPRGGRRIISRYRANRYKFQSTPPARGATFSSSIQIGIERFQSTPPARGATNQFPLSILLHKFQSTPPARGATGPTQSMRCAAPHHFNPRPPRGGRLVVNTVDGLKWDFNPRPPRGGRRRASGRK